jgi:hypothetical protein
MYIMLGFHLTASWQHCKNKHYNGGNVIPWFESFQLLKNCDHNVDKLGAHMKPLFGPTWRELLYEEVRGVILVPYYTILVLCSFTICYVELLRSNIISLPSNCCCGDFFTISLVYEFFGKSHEP